MTLNFTASVNPAREKLPTMDPETISESSSSSEDALHPSSAGGLWTTMASVLPMVTDSLEEQIITAGLLFVFWIYVNILNGSLMYVIRREYSLHTPQYMVLVSFMVCDTMYCNLTLLHMVPVVISNNIHLMNVTVARIITSIMISFLLSTVHLVALIAYERYCFFVTPLKYTFKFTKCRIYTSVTAIFLMAACVGVGGDLVDPRIAVATNMIYQLKGMGKQISNIFYLFLYIIPSGAMSVMTLIRLGQVISRHKAQVEQIGEDETAGSGNLVKSVKQAVKMVALVSGSFWLTTIPGFLIRLGLSTSGVTWADTDHRVSLAMFALSRGSIMLMTILSSVLNPIVYLSVLGEVREAVWKRIGIQSNADTRNCSVCASCMPCCNAQTVDIAD